MTRVHAVWALLALWFACFILAFVAFQATEPTGDSFLRGINRVGVFFGWQLAGLVPGAIAFVVSRPLPPGWLRRVACVPVGLLAAVVLLILGLILWSRLNSLMHPPEPYTAPVTAPAPDLAPRAE